jgi:YD repeat-containing protein
MAVHYGANEVLLETFEYDGNSNKTAFIDGQGNRVTYAYDGADRQIAVMEGAGSPVAATTTTTYNKVGNILTVKDGRNHGAVFDVQYTYDARYRKVSAANGESETTTYAYDANNNLTRLSEPLGASFATAYRYDELNKLLAVDDTPRRLGETAAGVTRFFYDGNRNKIAQQDANGNLVTYRYDGLNRLTDTFQHTMAGSLGNSSVRGGDPRGSNVSAGGNAATALHWHFAYDLNSNQNLIVDARGQRVAMTHDCLDRLETKTYSQHAEPGLDFQMQSIAYTYDGNGNVLSITEVKQLGGTNLTEHTDQTYDPLDRLQTKTRFDHDDPVGKRIEYDYDVQGNRSSVVDPDGIVTTYTYDARNRLDTATTTAGVTRYAYWEDSLLKSVAYPNGAVSDHSTANAYDRADRITLIDNRSINPSQHSFSSYVYTYDRNGTRVTPQETQEALNGGHLGTTAYT